MNKLYIGLLAISQLIVFAEIFYITKKLNILENFAIRFLKSEKEKEDGNNGDN